jgi:hypothetical protein
LKHALEELNRVVEAKEEIENRCRELDLQVFNKLIISNNLFIFSKDIYTSR